MCRVGLVCVVSSGRCGVGGEEVSARVPWLASAEGGARLQCGRRAGSSRLAVPVDCCLHFSLTGGHQPQGGTPTTRRIVFPKIWIVSTSCNQRWKYWLILSFISTGSNPCLLPGWLNNYQHNTPPLSIIQQYVGPSRRSLWFREYFITKSVHVRRGRSNEWLSEFNISDTTWHSNIQSQAAEQIIWIF